MSDAEKSKIVSSTEIAAALAEADAEGHIPDLDDASTREVVAIPVESGLPNGPKSALAGVEIPAVPIETVPLDAGPRVAPPPPQPPNTHSLPYWIADRVLWAINWPFAWLGPSARGVIGLVGVATLAASTTTMLLLAPGPSGSPPLDDVHNRAVTALTAKAASQPAAPE